MRALLSAIVAAVLCGCGGGLDSRLDGPWLGTWDLTVAGVRSTNNAGSVTLRLTDEGLTVSGGCGRDTLQGGGMGRAFSIDKHDCHESTTECSSVVLAYEGGHGAMSEDGKSLVLTLVGRMTVCGPSQAVSMAFTGSK